MIFSSTCVLNMGSPSDSLSHDDLEKDTSGNVLIGTGVTDLKRDILQNQSADVLEGDVAAHLRIVQNADSGTS